MCPVAPTPFPWQPFHCAMPNTIFSTLCVSSSHKEGGRREGAQCSSSFPNLATITRRQCDTSSRRGRRRVQTAAAVNRFRRQESKHAKRARNHCAVCARDGQLIGRSHVRRATRGHVLSTGRASPLNGQGLSRQNKTLLHPQKLIRHLHRHLYFHLTSTAAVYLPPPAAAIRTTLSPLRCHHHAGRRGV